MNANASALQALADTLDRAPPAVDLSPIEARLSALEAIPPVLDLSGLESRVTGLEVAPPVTPEAKVTRYGSFFDTTDQTAAAINTAYAITLNNTAVSSGVTIGSPASRIYVDRPGIYLIAISVQFVNTGGGAHRAWVWPRVNGVDVANRATVMRIEGSSTEHVLSWTFMQEFNAGDYFEFMWEVSDTGVSLFADPASAVHPAIPSVTITVTDNIEGG